MHLIDSSHVIPCNTIHEMYDRIIDCLDCNELGRSFGWTLKQRWTGSKYNQSRNVIVQCQAILVTQPYGADVLAIALRTSGPYSN